MAWGTDFIAEVYLNKLIFNNEIEVQNKIDENINEIEDAKQRIKMLVSSNPSDVIPDEWNDSPIDWLNNSVNDLFLTIIQLTEENVKLYQYIEFIVDNGENKIVIDWKDLNCFYVNITAKANALGFDQKYLEEMPSTSYKEELLELIKKYSEN